MALTISDQDIFKAFSRDLMNHGYGSIYFCDEYCGVYVNKENVVAEFRIDPVKKRVFITVLPGETGIPEILDTYNFETV